MNSKLEEAIAGLRCVNKPVKQIAKTLGVKKDAIEKIIKDWIIDTDPYINGLIGERKVNNIPDTNEMKLLVQMETGDLLSDKRILDYIAKKRNDHHDRFMDCIRYKIKIMLENKK
ncbi:hypothetical protein [Ferroplasma acidiphilum]|jgi:hypothetical protein|uniref:hypothetical protein n=1 Tax=Ferroplasma acidiphilum TaxID=74969 RepID=UPI0023F412D7|nr:hypothetical protein [Ferroplasma acidiphilum]